MEDFGISAELEQVERLLTRGRRPMPSAALRQRVLADVQRELHPRRFRPNRRFAAAFAATLLLGLWLAAAHATCFALQQRSAVSPIRELAAQIQRLTPDIAPEEAVRRAMLVEIASRVGCRSPLSDLLDADHPGQGIERAVR